VFQKLITKENGGKRTEGKEIRVHQKASKRDEYLEEARGLNVQVKPIIGAEGVELL
jgi:hypothetical protein